MNTTNKNKHAASRKKYDGGPVFEEKDTNSTTTKVVVNVILIVFSIVCLIPMLLTISVSITDNKTLLQQGYQIIPSKLSADAYFYLFQDPKSLLVGYKNSIIVTVFGSILNLLVTCLVAYPLSRRNFHFRGVISAYIFFTMIFSGGMVPTYVLVVQYLHWKDSLLALMIPVIAAPFNIFLMRVLFQDIPDSLVEAARIDGSSELNTFFRIILPLSKPALATLLLMIALGYWNDVFNPMLYIDSQQHYTIQLILQHIAEFVDSIKRGGLSDMSGNPIDPSTVPSDGVMYALMVVASTPMVFLFTFLQKYFVKGITAGAVKG